MEQDSHDEPNGDNPDDEDEGYIKDNGRSHASNGFRVDKSNGDDVLKTVSNLLLLGTSKKHGKVFGVVCGIGCLHLIKKSGIRNLRFTQPLKKVKIQYRTVQR